MVREIELLVDNETLNKKKGEVIKVYAFLAETLITEKKAKYAIIKKIKVEEIK